MGNRLKSLLQSGYPAIGSWIGFADPYSVELMADVGFDWLLIDTEHFPIDRRGLQTILIAMKGSETTPVVRVPNNSLEYFQTALDIGAQGVVVPMVSSRSDAELNVVFLDNANWRMVNKKSLESGGDSSDSWRRKYDAR